MTCISDVPYGATVRLFMRNGSEHQGKVIANYGASLVLKVDEDHTVSSTNTEIVRFDLIGKDSVAAFEIKRAKSEAEFSQLIETIRKAKLL